jgi:predicted kinase
MEQQRESAPRVTAGALRSLWTADRLDVRLRQGRLTSSHLRLLAEALATLHRPAADVTTRADLETQVRADADVLRGAAPALAASVDELEAELRDAARAPREPRPDCQLHGSLELARIHVDAAGRLQIGRPLAGVTGDPGEDVARLSVELAALGRADLAEELIAFYADATHDYGIYGSIALREGLTGLAAARGIFQSEIGSREPEQASRAAERMLRAALARMRQPRTELASPPLLVAVAGMIASGKSTLARAVGSALRAPVVSGDRSRDWLAEREPERALSTSAVYEVIARRAEAVLASGRPVMVDACLPTAAARAQLREVARRAGADFLVVECRVARSVLRRRLLERGRLGVPAAEDWMALLERSLGEWEPMTELPRTEHVAIHCGSDPDEALALALGAIAARSRKPRRARPAAPRALPYGIRFQS